MTKSKYKIRAYVLLFAPCGYVKTHVFCELGHENFPRDPPTVDILYIDSYSIRSSRNMDSLVMSRRLQFLEKCAIASTSSRPQAWTKEAVQVVSRNENEAGQPPAQFLKKSSW